MSLMDFDFRGNESRIDGAFSSDGATLSLLGGQFDQVAAPMIRLASTGKLTKFLASQVNITNPSDTASTSVAKNDSCVIDVGSQLVFVSNLV